MSTPESLTTLDDLIYRLRNYTTEDETRYSIPHDICDEAADALERLQSEVSALRDDAERWRFYDKAALASWRAKGVERIGEWLTYDAVMQFGSRNAAIDAARSK